MPTRKQTTVYSVNGTRTVYVYSKILQTVPHVAHNIELPVLQHSGLAQWQKNEIIVFCPGIFKQAEQIYQQDAGYFNNFASCCIEINGQTRQIQAKKITNRNQHNLQNKNQKCTSEEKFDFIDYLSFFGSFCYFRLFYSFNQQRDSIFYIAAASNYFIHSCLSHFHNWHEYQYEVIFLTKTPLDS